MLDDLPSQHFLAFGAFAMLVIFVGVGVDMLLFAILVNVQYLTLGVCDLWPTGTLLHFLGELSKSSDVNNATPSNLSICFAPSMISADAEMNPMDFLNTSNKVQEIMCFLIGMECQGHHFPSIQLSSPPPAPVDVDTKEQEAETTGPDDDSTTTTTPSTENTETEAEVETETAKAAVTTEDDFLMVDSVETNTTAT